MKGEQGKMVTLRNGIKLSDDVPGPGFVLGVFFLFLIATTSLEASACPGWGLCLSECK